MTLEEKFNELEKTIASLENPETSLEDSFKLYQTGMQMIKECNAEIDEVEKKVMVLEEDGTKKEFE